MFSEALPPNDCVNNARESQSSDDTVLLEQQCNQVAFTNSANLAGFLLLTQCRRSVVQIIAHTQWNIR